MESSQKKTSFLSKFFENASLTLNKIIASTAFRIGTKHLAAASGLAVVMTAAGTVTTAQANDLTETEASSTAFQLQSLFDTEQAVQLGEYEKAYLELGDYEVDEANLISSLEAAIFQFSQIRDAIERKEVAADKEIIPSLLEIRRILDGIEWYIAGLNNDQNGFADITFQLNLLDTDDEKNRFIRERMEVGASLEYAQSAFEKYRNDLTRRKEDIEDRIRLAEKVKDLIQKRLAFLEGKLNEMSPVAVDTEITSADIADSEPASILNCAALSLASILSTQSNLTEKIQDIAVSLVRKMIGEEIDIVDGQVMFPMSVLAQTLSEETGADWKGYNVTVEELKEALSDENDSIILHISRGNGHYISIIAKGEGQLEVNDSGSVTSVSADELGNYLSATYGWTSGAILTPKALPYERADIEKLKGAQSVTSDNYFTKYADAVSRLQERINRDYPQIQNAAAVAELLVQVYGPENVNNILNGTVAIAHKVNTGIRIVSGVAVGLEQLGNSGALSDVSLIFSGLAIANDIVDLGKANEMSKAITDFNALKANYGINPTSPLSKVFPKKGDIIKNLLIKHNYDAEQAFDSIVFSFIFEDSILGQYIPRNFKLSPALRADILSPSNRLSGESLDNWKTRMITKYSKDIMLDALIQYNSGRHKATSYDYWEMAGIIVGLPTEILRTRTDVGITSSGRLGGSSDTDIYYPGDNFTGKQGVINRLTDNISRISGSYSSSDLMKIVRGLNADMLPAQSFSFYDEGRWNSERTTVQGLLPQAAIENAVFKSFGTYKLSGGLMKYINKYSGEFDNASLASWANSVVNKYRNDIYLDIIIQRLEVGKKFSNIGFTQSLKNLVENFNPKSRNFHFYKANDATNAIKAADNYIADREGRVNEDSLRELKDLLKKKIGENYKNYVSDDDMRNELSASKNDVQRAYLSIIQKKVFVAIAMSPDAAISGWGYNARVGREKTGDRDIEWKEKPRGSNWSLDSYAKIRDLVVFSYSSIPSILPQGYSVSDSADYKMRAYLVSEEYKNAGNIDARLGKLVQKFKEIIVLDAQMYLTTQPGGTKSQTARQLQIEFNSISGKSNTAANLELVRHIKSSVFPGSTGQSDALSVVNSVREYMIMQFELPANYDFSDKIKTTMMNYYDENKSKYSDFSNIQWVTKLFEVAISDIAYEDLNRYKESISLGGSDYIPIISHIILSGATLYTRELRDMSLTITAGPNSAPGMIVDKIRAAAAAQSQPHITIFALLLNASPEESLDVYSQRDKDDLFKWIKDTEKPALEKAVLARIPAKYAIKTLDIFILEKMFTDYLNSSFGEDKRQWVNKHWAEYETEINEYIVSTNKTAADELIGTAGSKTDSEKYRTNMLAAAERLYETAMVQKQPLFTEQAADKKMYEFIIVVMARKQLNIFLPEEGYKISDKVIEKMIEEIKASSGLGLSEADMVERVLNKFQKDIFLDVLIQYKDNTTMKFGEKILLFFWTFTNDLPFGIGTISRAINESTALASADNETVLDHLKQKYSNRGYNADSAQKNDLLRGLSVKNTPLVVFSSREEEKIIGWVNKNEGKIAVQFLISILFEQYGIKISNKYIKALEGNYKHIVDSSRRNWIHEMMKDPTIRVIYVYILEKLADKGSTGKRDSDFFTNADTAKKALAENNLLVNIDEVVEIVESFESKPEGTDNALTEADTIRSAMLNERIKALRLMAESAPNDEVLRQALISNRYDVIQALQYLRSPAASAVTPISSVTTAATRRTSQSAKEEMTFEQFCAGLNKDLVDYNNISDGNTQALIKKYYGTDQTADKSFAKSMAELTIATYMLNMEFRKTTPDAVVISVLQKAVGSSLKSLSVSPVFDDNNKVVMPSATPIESPAIPKEKVKANINMITNSFFDSLRSRGLLEKSGMSEEELRTDVSKYITNLYASNISNKAFTALATADAILGEMAGLGLANYAAITSYAIELESAIRGIERGAPTLKHTDRAKIARSQFAINTASEVLMRDKRRILRDLADIRIVFSHAMQEQNYMDRLGENISALGNLILAANAIVSAEKALANANSELEKVLKNFGIAKTETGSSVIAEEYPQIAAFMDSFEKPMQITSFDLLVQDAVNSSLRPTTSTKTSDPTDYEKTAAVDSIITQLKKDFFPDKKSLPGEKSLPGYVPSPHIVKMIVGDYRGNRSSAVMQKWATDAVKRLELKIFTDVVWQQILRVNSGEKFDAIEMIRPLGALQSIYDSLSDSEKAGASKTANIILSAEANLSYYEGFSWDEVDKIERDLMNNIKPYNKSFTPSNAIRAFICAQYWQEYKLQWDRNKNFDRKTFYSSWTNNAMSFYRETFNIDAIQSELAKPNPDMSILKERYNNLLDSGAVSRFHTEQERAAVMAKADSLIYGRPVDPMLDTQIHQNLTAQDAADMVYDIFEPKYGESQAGKVRSALLDALPSLNIEVRYNKGVGAISLMTTIDNRGAVYYDLSLSANVDELISGIRTSESLSKLEKDIDAFNYPGHTLTKVLSSRGVYYYVDGDPDARIYLYTVGGKPVIRNAAGMIPKIETAVALSNLKREVSRYFAEIGIGSNLIYAVTSGGIKIISYNVGDTLKWILPDGTVISPVKADGKTVMSLREVMDAVNANSAGRAAQRSGVVDTPLNRNFTFYYDSKGNFVGTSPGAGLKGYVVEPFKRDSSPMDDHEFGSAIQTRGKLELLRETYEKRLNITLIDKYTTINGVEVLYWQVNGRPIYPFKETNGVLTVMTPADFSETVSFSQQLFDLKALTKETRLARELKDKKGNIYWEVTINGAKYNIHPIIEITKEDGTKTRRVLTKQELLNTIAIAPVLRSLKAGNSNVKDLKDMYDEYGSLYWLVNGNKIYPIKIIPGKQAAVLSNVELKEAIRLAPALGRLKSGNTLTRNARVEFDEDGNLVWKVKIGEKFYNIYPIKVVRGVNTVLTAQELEEAIRLAPDLARLREYAASKGYVIKVANDEDGNLVWKVKIGEKFYNIYPVKVVRGENKVLTLPEFEETIRLAPELGSLRASVILEIKVKRDANGNPIRDANGNLILGVEIDGKFHEVKDIDGKFYEVKDIKELHSLGKLVEINGKFYKVEEGLDPDGNLIWRVTIDGKVYEIYPVKVVRGINTVIREEQLKAAIRNAPLLYELKTSLIKAGIKFVTNKDGGIDFIDDEGYLYWKYEVDGKSYKIYPVDRKGNVLTLEQVQRMIRNFPILSKLQDDAQALGIKFATNKDGGIDFYDDVGGLYWMIEGYERPELRIYPVNEYGEVMTIEEIKIEALTDIKIKQAALDAGEKGAYLIVEDPLIITTQKEKDRSLLDFIMKTKLVDYRTWLRRLWDNICSLFGYETESYERYDTAFKETLIADDVKDLSEIQIMQALSALKPTEETWEINGKVIGKIVVTITDVRKLEDGTFIYIYMKEYMEEVEEDGKKIYISKGEEYFAEYNGKVYVAWYTPTEQARQKAEAAVTFKGISAQVEGILSRNRYEKMGELLAAVNAGRTYELVLNKKGDSRIVFSKDVQSDKMSGLAIEGEIPSEAVHILSRNREELLAAVNDGKTYELLFGENSKIAFRKDESGKMIAAVQQNGDMYGEWKPISIGNPMEFSFSGGRGGFQTSLLYLNQLDGGEVGVEGGSQRVYYARAYSVNDINNAPNVVSGISQSTDGSIQRVEHILATDGGKQQLQLSQSYGDAYAIEAATRKAVINGTTEDIKAGRDVREFTIKHSEVYLGGQIRLIDGTLVSISDKQIRLIDALVPTTDGQKEQVRLIDGTLIPIINGNITFKDGRSISREKAENFLRAKDFLKKEMHILIGADSKYYDNDMITLSHMDGIVSIRDSKSGEGYSFLGGIKVREDGLREYYAKTLIGHYKTYEFGEITENGMSAGDSKNIENLFTRVRNENIGFPYKPSDLRWAKSQVLDPSDPTGQKVLYETWAAYNNFSSQPVVKITEEGFIDFSGKYNGMPLGLRYDLKSSDESQMPVNLTIPVEGVGTMIIDYHSGSVFIEEREGEGQLLSKYHVTILNSSKLFPNVINEKLQPLSSGWDWKDSINQNDWRLITGSENMQAMVQNVNNFGLTAQNTQQILKVTRKEEYSYQDVAAENTLTGEDYTAVQLAFLGIPSHTISYHINDNGEKDIYINERGEEVGLSKSSFQGIDWTNGRIYVKDNVNSIVESDQQQSAGNAIRARTIVKQMDLRGNVKQQFDIENGQYVSGIIVPEHDRYGTGLRSYTLTIEKNGNVYVTSSSKFNSIVVANALVYEQNVRTVLFAHERTQIEDRTPKGLPDNIKTDDLTIFSLQGELLDKDGNLLETKTENGDQGRLFTEKAYLLNNAEGRNLITLSNFLVDKNGEIVKVENDKGTNSIETLFGNPAIISFGEYAADAISEEQRQLMLGHPRTIVSYGYDGSLDFDVYGAKNADGSLKPIKEAVNESDFITKMNDLKVIDTDKGVSLIYTSYGNPNFNVNNFIKGYINRAQLYRKYFGKYSDDHAETVAQYIVQMSGLKAVGFNSDGLKFFEVYDYDLLHNIAGNINIGTYEINVLNRMGRAEYGYLIDNRDDNKWHEFMQSLRSTDAASSSSEELVQKCKTFLENLYKVDTAIKNIPLGEGENLSDLAEDPERRGLIPFEVEGIRISRIWSDMDAGVERKKLFGLIPIGTASRVVFHNYYEVNHLNTGEEPIMQRYQYKYNDRGVLVAKYQSDIVHDWRGEFKKIYDDYKMMLKEHPVKALALTVSIVGLIVYFAAKVIRAKRVDNKRRREIMGRTIDGGQPLPPSGTLEDKALRPAVRDSMNNPITKGLNDKVIKVIRERYADLGFNKTESYRAIERQFISDFLKYNPQLTERSSAADISAFLEKQAADQKMFDDYKWWVRNVMAEAQVLNEFTNEDRLLFDYIYIATNNMRQDDMAFRNMLFYKAKQLIADGKAKMVGIMIDTEANRMLNVVENGLTIKQQVEQMKAVLELDRARAADARLLTKRQIKKLNKAIAYYEKNDEELDALEKTYRASGADAPNFAMIEAKMDELYAKYGFRVLFGVKGASGRGKMRPDETITYYDFDAMFRKPGYVAKYSAMVDDFVREGYTTNINNTPTGKLGFSPIMMPFRVYIPHSGVGGSIPAKVAHILFSSPLGLLQALTNLKGIITVWLANLGVTLGIIAGINGIFTGFFGAVGLTILGFQVLPFLLVAGVGVGIALIVNRLLNWAGNKLQKYNTVNEYWGKTIDNSQDRGLEDKNRQDIKSAKKAMTKRWVLVLIFKTVWESFLLNTVVKSIIATMGGSISSASLVGSGLVSFANPIMTAIIIALLVLSLFVIYHKAIKKFVEAKATDINTGEQRNNIWDKWRYSLTNAITVSVSILTLVLGALLLYAVPGYMTVALLILPFLLFTFLDFFGFWEIFKGLHMWSQKKKEGYFAGKSWDVWQKAFYGNDSYASVEGRITNAKALSQLSHPSQADFDALRDMRDSQFFKEWDMTFLSKKVSRKLTPKQKTTAFALYFNKIIMSYYRTGKISAQEYEKYKFEISDYAGGNNLDRTITKMPILDIPKSLGGREMFYRLFQETNIRARQGLRTPDVKDISVSAVIPTYGESVTHLLDNNTGGATEKLNSDKLNPDGHILLTHLIEAYDGEWANMLSRLDEGVDFRGLKKTLNEDDKEVLAHMKDMLYENGKVKKGQELRRAGGHELPDCWIKQEISRWADEKLQPLSPTQLGVLNLREALDFIIEIEYADQRNGLSETDWQEKVHSAGAQHFEIVSGYQSFGDVYKDGAGINDPRYIGLAENLKLYREMIVPVMHRMKHNNSQYKLLKEKEIGKLASDYEKELINQIENEYERRKAIKKMQEEYNELIKKAPAGRTEKDRERIEEIENGDFPDSLKEYFFYQRFLRAVGAQSDRFYQRFLRAVGARAFDGYMSSRISEIEKIRKEHTSLMAKPEADRTEEDNKQIKELQAKDIIFQWEKFDVYQPVELTSFRHLKAQDVSLAAYNKLLEKKNNNTAPTEELALLDAVEAEIKKEKAKYERWKKEGKETSLVEKYNDDQIKTIFNNAENKKITVVVFDDTGTTVSPVHGVIGMGKVDHHTHLEGDVSKEFILQLDMNQNIFVQSALSLFGALTPMVEDEEVYNVSLQEQIPTKRLTNVGAKGASAEEGFNASHADMNELWQLHMYGHPNFLRTRFIKSMSGQSKGLVSEDATAGQAAKTKGGKTVALGGYVVEKTREARNTEFTAMFIKFASGAVEMTQSSYVYEYNKAQRRAFGRFGSIFGEATNFVGGYGFYIKEWLTTLTITTFLFAILFLGISGFSGFGFAFILALIGLVMSQSGAVIGFVKDMYAFNESLGGAFKKLVINFIYFVDKIRTHSTGASFGLLGKAAHANTGRGSGTALISILAERHNGETSDDAIANAKKSENAVMATMNSHFIPEASNILIIAASFLFSASMTFFLSVVYIIIPFGVMLGQSALLPGFNIFQYPAKEVFKNIKNESKKWMDIVFGKEVKEIKDAEGNITGYSARPSMPRFLTFLVGGIMLLTLSAASLLGFAIKLIVSGIDGIVKFGNMLGASLAIWRNGWGGGTPILVISPALFIFVPIVLLFSFSIYWGYRSQKKIIEQNKDKISKLKGEVIAAEIESDNNKDNDELKKQAEAKRKEYEELLGTSYTESKIKSLLNSLDKDKENINAKMEIEKFSNLYFMQGQSIASVNDKLTAERLDVSAFKNMAEVSEIMKTYAALQRIFGTKIEDGLRTEIELGRQQPSQTAVGDIEAEAEAEIKTAQVVQEPLAPAEETAGQSTPGDSAAESISEPVEPAKTKIKAIKDYLRKLIGLVAGRIHPGVLIRRLTDKNIVEVQDGQKLDLPTTVQLFVENYDISEETRKQVSSINEIGIKAAIIQRVGKRKDIPENEYKRIKPHTIVQIKYGESTYDIKVEHYIPNNLTDNIESFRANSVIQTVVSHNKHLEEEISDKTLKEKLYNRAYILSTRYFAADLNDNKKIENTNKDVNALNSSGIGMIVYKGVSLDNEDDEKRIDTGILELNGEEIATYYVENSFNKGKTEELKAAISASEDRGKEWQMPGYEYGLMIDTQKSKIFDDKVKTENNMKKEISRNVTLVRISHGDMKRAIERIWKESEGIPLTEDELKDVVRIKNILDASKEMKKIADLNASDLINEDKTVNEELIKRVYQLKFNGIYADVTGLDEAKAEYVIKAIAEAAKKYGIDTQNYIIFDGNNAERNNEMLSANKKLLEAEGITGVIRFEKKYGEEERKEMIDKSVNETIAIEMPEMTKGKREGKTVSVAFAAKIKSDKTIGRRERGESKSAVERYNVAHKSGLKSNYILNIEAKNIEKLKEYMTSKEEKNFEGMLEALKKAGIGGENVMCQYILQRAKENTAESYAEAKGYLRGSVENYLEREYIKYIKVKGETYKKVGVGDRKAIRSLLLYLSINGEEINESTIKAIFEQQRASMEGEDSSIRELMEEVNGLINEIVKDPFSVSAEKKGEAKRAVTLIGDSIAGLVTDTMIENAKTGAKISASAVRQILQAA
ncbi:MAG: hypothetical protein LBD46_08700 [Endomicrobium sp.]|jgi:hypothetical protein|nr:hypothetical protein [Endomicrobium sp.]